MHNGIKNEEHTYKNHDKCSDCDTKVFGTDVRYVTSQDQWYIWNRTIWEPDTQNKILQLGKSIGHKLYQMSHQLPGHFEHYEKDFKTNARL